MLYKLELVIEGVKQDIEITSDLSYGEVLDAKITELNREGKEVYLPCKLCGADIINSKTTRLSAHKNMDSAMIAKTNSTERLYNMVCKYAIERDRETITGFNCVNPNRTVNLNYPKL